MTYVFPMMTK